MGACKSHPPPDPHTKGRNVESTHEGSSTDLSIIREAVTHFTTSHNARI